ncbi:LysR family transcriptional regulator [Methylosinus sp. H3A]|uniref:LysR family transcriptional regulator n=1 Tax=Methylosinus sp. H3A TaxID=2785786 RepID=UPI0018C3008D|nr:LysR family transcriptional regulator [Methylosinus sp. H3A]MBG0811902.1 LysR family transcriptional regulator [Methylosinus sp. H3A]
MSLDPRSHLSGVAAFVHSAQSGSFTAAAAQMGLSKSAVAKTVGRLEERLGARLLDRTTRSLGLTADGRAYYESCLKVLAELESAEALLASRRQTVGGLLRVSLPIAFGRLWVMPALLELARRHAELDLDISFTDRNVLLVEEGVDLVVRLGEPGDLATLIGRKLGTQRALLCAAPAYLDARGRPRTPTEIAGHDCVAFSHDGRTLPWRLRGEDGAAVEIGVRPRHRLGHGEALRDAALAGAGLALLPLWLIDQDLKSGRLESLLAEATEPAPIHALWPRAKDMAPKVRMTVDELLRRFAPVPPWERRGLE